MKTFPHPPPSPPRLRGRGNGEGGFSELSLQGGALTRQTVLLLPAAPPGRRLLVPDSTDSRDSTNWTEAFGGAAFSHKVMQTTGT